MKSPLTLKFNAQACDTAEIKKEVLGFSKNWVEIMGGAKRGWNYSPRGTFREKCDL